MKFVLKQGNGIYLKFLKGEMVKIVVKCLCNIIFFSFKTKGLSELNRCSETQEMFIGLLTVFIINILTHQQRELELRLLGYKCVIYKFDQSWLYSM